MVRLEYKALSPVYSEAPAFQFLNGAIRIALSAQKRWADLISIPQWCD